MRQFNKALYLLIEKYHRLYGLEFFFFSRSGGPGHWGFQLACNRTWCARQRIIFPKDYPRAIQFATCGYVGKVEVAPWSVPDGYVYSPDEVRLEHSQNVRTSEVVAWFEEHMQLRKLFEHYSSELERWRGNYSVEDAEKYILMTQLMGLISQLRDTVPNTPIQEHGLPYACDDKKIDEIHRTLGVRDGSIDVVGVKDFWITRDAKGLVNGQLIDFWKLYLEGMAVEQMIKLFVK